MLCFFHLYPWICYETQQAVVTPYMIVQNVWTISTARNERFEPIFFGYNIIVMSAKKTWRPRISPTFQKQFFRQAFLSCLIWGAISIERLQKFQDKLLSMLSQLDENSSLVVWNILYHVSARKQTIKNNQSIKTCRFMLISPWKKLAQLYTLFVILLCFAGWYWRNIPPPSPPPWTK